MRLAASNEGIDHTGEIISFTAIGTGVGPVTALPRPWICFTTNTNNVYVEWQFPDGTTVPAADGNDPATGDQLNTRRDGALLLLYRGPMHNSPDGEHCCVVTTTRRCVTFSEWCEL